MRSGLLNVMWVYIWVYIRPSSGQYNVSNMIIDYLKLPSLFTEQSMLLKSTTTNQEPTLGLNKNRNLQGNLSHLNKAERQQNTKVETNPLASCLTPRSYSSLGTYASFGSGPGTTSFRPGRQLASFRCYRSIAQCREIQIPVDGRNLGRSPLVAI